MPLFISSTSSATRHDVYAIKKTPQSQLRARGTGRVAIVGQFPWGPDPDAYLVTDLAQAKQLFAPPGMTRTGYGYLSLLSKAYPELVLARVLGSAAAKATATLADSPTNIATLTAKYKGTAGNSLVATVSDASDGDSDHFDLSVTITGASGTTTDTIKNINFSSSGTVSTFSQSDLDKLQLIGAPVRLNAGRPDNGTYTFASGADGTINSAAYIGTPESGDKGIAALEADRLIRHVCVDYPGSSLLAAVNAGLVAHKTLLGDRFVYLSHQPGQTLATVQSDVEDYRGSGVEYVDGWVYIYDDTTGTEQLVPGTTFAASVAAQLAPSTSPAWKNQEVRDMLGGIIRLETDRGMGAASNTAAGIWTLIREARGGHTFEAAVNTCAPTDPANANYTTTAMDIYIATAFVDSVRGSVDAPNVQLNRDDLKFALNGFMATLKKNVGRDPNHTPHVVDYALPPLESANTNVTLAAGDVHIPLQVQYSSGMERIFLIMQSGTSGLTVQTQP